MAETQPVYFRVARAIAELWKSTAAARGITLGALIEKTMMKDRGIKASIESQGIEGTLRERARTGAPAKVLEYIERHGEKLYGIIVDDLQDKIARADETSVGERRRRVMNAINWLVRSGDLKRDETTDIVSLLGE